MQSRQKAAVDEPCLGKERSFSLSFPNIFLDEGSGGLMEKGQDQIEFRCEFCGSNTREDVVNMALWEEGNLIVIEDVKARICDQCHEQFYDSETTWKIDKLRQEGFRPENAEREIKVPVFSLRRVKISELNFPHPVLGEDGTIE